MFSKSWAVFIIVGLIVSVLVFSPAKFVNRADMLSCLAMLAGIAIVIAWAIGFWIWGEVGVVVCCGLGVVGDFGGFVTKFWALFGGVGFSTRLV